jgi:small subunit ribosomal protein S2
MVIPGNDDAIRSIRLITKIIADSCARGLESSKGFSPKADTESPVIQTIKKEAPVLEVHSEEPVVKKVASEETTETIKNEAVEASQEISSEEKETNKDDN